MIVSFSFVDELFGVGIGAGLVFTLCLWVVVDKYRRRRRRRCRCRCTSTSTSTSTSRHQSHGTSDISKYHPTYHIHAPASSTSQLNHPPTHPSIHYSSANNLHPFPNFPHRISIDPPESGPRQHCLLACPAARPFTVLCRDPRTDVRAETQGGYSGCLFACRAATSTSTGQTPNRQDRSINLSAHNPTVR